jgi:DNA-directed RNA polymerase subunit beta'
MKTIGFKNQIFTKKELKQVMYQIFTDYGLTQASQLADELKSLGFSYATQAGISISIEDLKITPTKPEILELAEDEIKKSNKNYDRGSISSIERFQTVINTWNNTSESIKNSLVSYFTETDPLNPIYLMAFSGARGNLSQVRQLVGMRGLMSDPNGQIIDIPIIHNFREGLTITDYIMSSYGARKGVVDTALKTADSGYLTRRLVDVAQDVVIREYNCLTNRSVTINFTLRTKQELLNKIIGRTCARDLLYSLRKSKKLNIFPRDSQISKSMALSLVTNSDVKSIHLRSPLVCESLRSVCQLCYGWNLASAALVSLGEAIGIIAAQSIGEPGTQLTMRTFHTGGIFTADPSRQIRANFSGVINFESELKFRWGRTIYGTIVKVLNQSIQFRLISYTNQTIYLTLEANSLLFVNNGQSVKFDQLLGELPVLNQKTIKEKKPIFSPIDGEFLPRLTENIVWILRGQIFDIPDQSFVNNLKEYKIPINSIDRFTTSKLVAKQTGLVNLKRNRAGKISTLQTISSVAKLGFVPFFDFTSNVIFLVSKFFDFYKIPLHYFKNANESISLLSYSNPYYYIPTTGNIYLVQKTQLDLNINFRLLYTPEEVHLIHRDSSLLLIDPFVQLIESGIELVRGRFSIYSGFFNIVESNDIIQTASIKPGLFYSYTDITAEEFEYLQTLNNKIFYPGEILFDDIEINFLTLIEFVQAPFIVGIVIRPLLDFNVPRPESKPAFNSVNRVTLLTNSIQTLPIVQKDNVSIRSEGCLIKKQMTIKFSVPVKFKLIHFHPYGILSILINEDRMVIQRVVSKYNEKKVYFSSYFDQFQFVEKGTVLGLLNTNINESTKYYESLEIQSSDSCRIMFTTHDDYKVYYFENALEHIKSVKFIKSFDSINNNYQITESGQLVSCSPYSIKIRRGTPLFYNKSIQLSKIGGSFVRKDEPLGFITYEQVITGDIVQGLPKIEEILEARKPFISAQLSSFSGIVKTIEKKIDENEILIFINLKTSQKDEVSLVVKNLLIGQELLCAPTDYINLGQPLTTGSINPHDVLIVLFKFYKRTNSFYMATYLSFKNLQILLINKIQQVYNSQGVDIADKHLEIIVRQMTSKVRILNPGSTSLTQSEVIDLLQIRYINEIIQKNSKLEATYSPVLCGITKASLLTDSFISAASFQETTKILMAAAIKGKVDWLRGLKENVIIGRLIPAGTGFMSEDNFGFEQLTFS